jgi:uncharacterized protein YbcV (DUF1398 family)
MNAELTEILRGCTQDSHDPASTFPQIVGRLAAAGVERYHADLNRRERTYYLPDGDSLVVASTEEALPIAAAFSAAAVEGAIRQSQRNEHTYDEFLGKIRAAGCVGYFVQITGRQALYFGRQGECHVEPFPTAPVRAGQ